MGIRVISYTRMSTKRQHVEGTSEERQEDLAKAWCERNGYELDENIADLGVSAFRGKHRNKGALSLFLKRVEEGRVPKGSFLLIENFDRLTREEISDAQDLVKSILKKGVNIVTLLDNERVYTSDSLNDLGTLFVMMAVFSRAHEESRSKGDRVARTFEKMRKNGEKVFGAAPGWLKRVEGHKSREWEVIPELAAVVVKVFEKAAEGLGGPSIARLANSEKWPVPTRATKKRPNTWHSKMPSIILRNRGVLGEAQLMLRGRLPLKEARSEVPVPHGAPIPDYYPRVVSDELWHRARGAISAKKTAPPKRDENYFNIFAGLMRCGHCGGMIQRKVELRGHSRAQLVCARKLAGITSCKTASALKTDERVLFDICAYAGRDMGLGYEEDAARDDINIATAKLQEISQRLDKAAKTSELFDEPVPELIANIRSLQAERKKLESIISERNEMLAVKPNSLLDTSYADKVIEQLYVVSNEAMLLRADCNLRMRRVVAAVWVWAYDMVAVQFKRGNHLLTLQLAPKAKEDRSPMWEASWKGELVLPSLEKSQ